MEHLFLQNKIENKTVGFQFDKELNANATFGFSNGSDYVGALTRNRVYMQSPFMWNLNYQGIMYDSERINERNKTTIFA